MSRNWNIKEPEEYLSFQGPWSYMITSRVLKLCVLKLLIQRVAPHNPKSSFLVPLRKAGASSNERSYSPIVIQPAFAKVFENVLLDMMTFTFENLTTSTTSWWANVLCLPMMSRCFPRSSVFCISWSCKNTLRWYKNGEWTWMERPLTLQSVSPWLIRKPRRFYSWITSSMMLLFRKLPRFRISFLQPWALLRNSIVSRETLKLGHKPSMWFYVLCDHNEGFICCSCQACSWVILLSLVFLPRRTHLVPRNGAKAFS